MLLSGVLQRGDADIVEVLLDEGATVDRATLDGFTPLALAARVSASRCIAMSAVHCMTTMLLTGVMQGGHANIVQVLLTNIAKLGNATCIDQEPLAQAAEVNVSRGIVVLCCFMAHPPRFMQRGHTEVVRVILNHGTNPNESTPEGNTVLAWAAQVGA